MLARTEFIDLIQRIDSDFLGVILLIGTIGCFVTAIVFVVSIVRTINNVTLTRMQHSMVKNLLSQGYSVEDTERLAYGTQRWGARIKSIARSASSGIAKFNRSHTANNYPMPPTKQTA
jgi:hypothetical protein